MGKNPAHGLVPDLESESGRIIIGDSIEAMAALPAESVDLIFADPPYNLQLAGELLRPDNSRVDGVDQAWDRFDDFAAYDKFTRDWLVAAKRVLKPNGSLWVIGSYHNIFRVGATLQDLGFWILNDVIWRKSNPMPNFRGRRFTNAHETMIWCAPAPDARRYTFNYDAMKSLNEGLQMRSDWLLPICGGAERLKIDGRKAHPTQKPESLLARIIMASSGPGDLVLDPFLGSGTTAAVARRLSRRYIGIEQDESYARLAHDRVQSVVPLDDPEVLEIESRRAAPRVPFGSLLDRGMVKPGDKLFDTRRRWEAKVRADGTLITAAPPVKGSIHSVAAAVQGAQTCNGWTFWHVEQKGNLVSIDLFRQQVRSEIAA